MLPGNHPCCSLCCIANVEPGDRCEDCERRYAPPPDGEGEPALGISIRATGYWQTIDGPDGPVWWLMRDRVPIRPDFPTKTTA
jgi:hypothetical protein